MQIMPISFYINNKQTPSFKSTDRIVTGKFATKTYSNYTEFLRDDLNWKNFINLVKSKYKNVSKISIINHACSDGSEPMSLAMMIREYIPNPERFFPVKAYDYDSIMVNKAEKGPTWLIEEDFARLDKLLPKWQNKYLKYNNGYKYLVNRRENLQKDIKFKQKNILDDFGDGIISNTIVLARNCWAYLEGFEQKILTYKLANALDDSCLLVIGALEKTYGIDKLLEQNGFRKTNVEYVYTPPTI